MDLIFSYSYNLIFLFVSGITRNVNQPMNFCYKMGFSLSKQPQKSRFLGLFWKGKTCHVRSQGDESVHFWGLSRSALSVVQ